MKNVKRAFGDKGPSLVRLTHDPRLGFDMFHPVSAGCATQHPTTPQISVLLWARLSGEPPAALFNKRQTPEKCIMGSKKLLRIYQRGSLRSIPVTVFSRWGQKTSVMKKKTRVLPSIKQCVNIAGWCCGEISRSTFSPLMKVEESHGVSTHHRRPGTSPHCRRARTSANWFSLAGTCPRHKTHKRLHKQDSEISLLR